MTLAIAEVLDAARQHGVPRLPEPSQLSIVRVWSTGLDSQWIAELGEPPVNRPLDRIFETEEQARTAGLEAGKETRAILAAALRNAGASEIADAEWEPLTLHLISGDKDTATQVIAVM